MKLIELYREASKYDSIISFFESGKVHFSDMFIREAGIELPNRVTFHRNQEDSTELYISFNRDKGIPMRERKDVKCGRMGLTCSSAATIHQLRQFLVMKAGKTDFKKVCFRISTKPIQYEGIDVYAIITREVIQKQ